MLFISDRKNDAVSLYTFNTYVCGKYVNSPSAMLSIK